MNKNASFLSLSLNEKPSNEAYFEPSTNPFFKTLSQAKKLKIEPFTLKDEQKLWIFTFKFIFLSWKPFS